MESPVVVDKPPEYHGNDRGFPFEEEEGSGAWSELAARHPDIAARLRQRPATWARKRRPSSHDATDDFGDSFGGFDRFPFDDIPSEFREHFPSHWNRRFGPRDEPQPTQAPHSPQPHQHTTATQTEQDQDIGPAEHDQQTPLPQYGLRNTVDLVQKSPADPSLVDADERAHRSMSAPPDTPNQTKMSGQNHHEQGHAPQHNEQPSNVRHIPIFVEGRDEPVINKSVDHGAHYADSKPTYAPPPPQPHVDRDQYFADEPVNFHPPPNFSRSFGTPFNKGFRQGPQPFVQQKVYPQTAYARATSPQRGQSPKPQPHVEEHYVKVPVHHEQAAPKTEAPSRAQKSPQQQQPPPRPQQQAPPQQQQQPQQQHQQQQQHHQVPTREPTPPKPQPPSANDPITLILSIQTDVLNLMSEVENFKGTKKDKKYLFLDEMLTRNLIKLDNIETEGKENIRQARKEAIKCIQKCIAVLEAKAESNSAHPQPESVPEQESVVQEGSLSQPQDVEMKENNDIQEKVSDAPVVEQLTQNGEVDMNDIKETNAIESEPVVSDVQITPAVQEDQALASKQENTENDEPKTQERVGDAPTENKETVPTGDTEVAQPQAADTRPDDNIVPEEVTVPNVEQKVEEKDKKSNPKKVTKTTKKRDKSKDKKEDKDSNKEEKAEDQQEKTEQKEKLEAMQVDDKGDKTDSQVMEVDGAASQ